MNMILRVNVRQAVFLLTVGLFSAVGSGQVIAQKPIRVACVGDSITKGTYENVYPTILQQMLGEGFEVMNFGVGATTLLQSGTKPYTGQSAFRDAVNYRANIVVIMLGTNDSKLEDWHRSASFAKDYTSLIAAFRKQNPTVQIYACTPPPVVADAWGIRGKVIAAEVRPKIIASARGAKLIDVHAAFDGKVGLHSDGVHPNAAGARLIAEQVYGAVARTSKEKPSR